MQTSVSVQTRFATLDGNEAVARVAYALNEVIAIYPITPASPMGEWADAWAASNKPNLWGTVPAIVEMQSEGGVAGAVHGSVATQALSIFGDHSDVMAVRSTGFGMLCSASVQEAQDMAAIATIASLASRVPFIHFFDGFRTSHEVQKIELLADESLNSLIDNELITQLQYYGDPNAERVIVLLGSGCETAQSTVDTLNEVGENVGVVKVRLYRPFDARRFAASLSKTVKAISILDRTKEPGGAGEPLYLDVLSALVESHFTTLDNQLPMIVGGRYGLSSKEFTPAMVKAVFDNLLLDGFQHNQKEPKNHFTIGIDDDVTHTSLAYDAIFSIEPEQTIRAVFYGLGSDGTVGANKNTIKIIGKTTDNHAQGYFVYDSKKSGSVTISHLRFGPDAIHAPYLIAQANFIACHQWMLLDQLDILGPAMPGATLLLNSPYTLGQVWDKLPERIQSQILQKHLEVYVINAYEVARSVGLGGRINTVMQTCFFALSKILPPSEVIAAIRASISKTYAKKGDKVVLMNLEAVDQTLQNLFKIPLPDKVPVSKIPSLKSPVAEAAPPFVKTVLSKLMSR
ncbi:2-oxoacid:acceptor oxidoreductase family protein [Leptothoe spongobia]|uniref:2-oxoacid:acceptor oxidoreductase family protein n=1 Tax=Leptothoe spongobia TaxID=2651728 RepID=UPI001FE861ED|nr:2-oxoacid:acceptor oxidoreductase family protein [Leptothoe spongobia]